MTTSPTFTSSATRPSPSSFHRPGRAATTVPSWGFSLAVSGITRPDAVVWSPSLAWTTIRSSSGRSLKSANSWVTPSGGPTGCPGRRKHSRVLSANRIARRVPADKAGSGRGPVFERGGVGGGGRGRRWPAPALPGRVGPTPRDPVGDASVGREQQPPDAGRLQIGEV